MRSKKAVVTGGAGFIGSHLVEGLVDSKYHTVVLDNLSSGKVENIKDWLDKPNFEFVQDSITNLTLLKKLFVGADYVFHQAAIVSVPRSVADPLVFNETNITGTLNVLLAARDNNVKKVVYASSSSVYGEASILPKRENMTPIPCSPYAITKLTGEYYCLAFQELYNLSTISLRYFNVFGPKQDPNSEYAAVIPKFIKNVLEGKPPIIFGDGNQTRDFTYVKDVVKANIVAAESDATGIFNIGSGKNVTINELANLILKLFKSDLEPIHQEPRTGDIHDSLADISKAKAIGCEPQYTLEDALRETKRRFLA